MLAPDVMISDVDPRHWRNGFELLVPPRVLSAPRWALAVIDGGAVLKLVIAGRDARGAIEHTGPTPALTSHGLEAWARHLGVDAMLVVEQRVMGALSVEIEGELRLDQDLVEQGLIVLRALKRHAGTAVWTFPSLLELLPAPGFEPVQRTFDLLIPDRSALVAYVIDDDRRRVHTSVIALKDHGDITRVSTHAAIADLVSETQLAKDWNANARRVVSAVEHRFARPSIAVFVERQTLLGIVTGPSDQLARELNAKRIIIDPAPAWLLGLLGGAAVAAVAGRAAKGLASLLPSAARDRASAFASRARDALKDSGAHPFALLGFDPLELWARLRVFYDRR